jgi:accessory gene regulator protein AgrB
MNMVTERKLGGLFIHARTCTISAISSTHALAVVPSRHRSRSKRAILMISIVHMQFLSTTYDLMECCLVVSFLCFRTQGHFDNESSLPSI